MSEFLLSLPVPQLQWLLVVNYCFLLFFTESKNIFLLLRNDTVFCSLLYSPFHVTRVCDFLHVQLWGRSPHCECGVVKIVE